MTDKYTNAQLESNYPNGIENHYWNKSRNKILCHFLKRNNLHDKKILEIGCGRGVVVNYLVNNGMDCFGVDLANGKPMPGSKNVSLNTNAFDLNKDFRLSVQVILLLDVIEHIKQPKDFLNSIKKSFPNASWLVLTVPARNEIWSNYDEFYGHHHRYTRRMLKKQLDHVQPTLVKSQYLFHALYYPALLLKAFRKKRNVHLLAPIGNIQITIHSIIARLFFYEYALGLSKTIGTSILCKLKFR